MICKRFITQREVAPGAILKARFSFFTSLPGSSLAGNYFQKFSGFSSKVKMIGQGPRHQC